MTNPVTFTIGGRRFVIATPPFRADHRLYLAAEAAATGLDLARQTMSRAIDPTAGARDVFVAAAQSGRLPWLLAGLLVEDWRAWRRRDALETAEKFAALSGPADLAAFDLAVAAVLVGVIGSFAGAAAPVDLSALSSALADFSSLRVAARLN